MMGDKCLLEPRPLLHRQVWLYYVVIFYIWYHPQVFLYLEASYILYD